MKLLTSKFNIIVWSKVVQSFSFHIHIKSLLSVRVIVTFSLLDVLRKSDTVYLPCVIPAYVCFWSFLHAFVIRCVSSRYTGRHAGSMKRLISTAFTCNILLQIVKFKSMTERVRPGPNASPLMCRAKLNKVRLWATLERLWSDGWFRRRTCVELNSGSSWQTVFDEKTCVPN